MGYRYNNSRSYRDDTKKQTYISCTTCQAKGEYNWIYKRNLGKTGWARCQGCNQSWESLVAHPHHRQPHVDHRAQVQGPVPAKVPGPPEQHDHWKWLCQQLEAARQAGQPDKIDIWERCCREAQPAEPEPAPQPTKPATRRVAEAANNLGRLERQQQRLRKQLIENAEARKRLQDKIDDIVDQMVDAEADLETANQEAKEERESDGINKRVPEDDDEDMENDEEVFPTIAEDELELLDEQTRNEYKQAKEYAQQAAEQKQQWENSKKAAIDLAQKHKDTARKVKELASKISAKKRQRTNEQGDAKATDKEGNGNNNQQQEAQEKTTAATAASSHSQGPSSASTTTAAATAAAEAAAEIDAKLAESFKEVRNKKAEARAKAAKAKAVKIPGAPKPRV